MHWVPIAMLFVLIGLAGPLMILLNAPAPPGDYPFLVIGPSATEVVEASGGRLIGPTIAPLAVLATGDPGFADRLSAMGAWVVTDGRWVARICGVAV